MTDLESEIDTLRELDNLRLESEQLRKDGIEVLTTILTKAKDCTYGNHSALARISMTLWELASDPPEQLHEWKKKLENLTLVEITDKYPLPLLLAADIIQALAVAPSFAVSKSSIYSYYLISRELYTADAPDWAVGGVRAHSKDGMVSAYVTRECVRAIRSLALVLERTSAFIAEIGAFQKRLDLLQTSFPELETWVLMDKARLQFHLHTTIRSSSRRHMLRPLKHFTDKPKDLDIEKVIAEIAFAIKRNGKDRTRQLYYCTGRHCYIPQGRENPLKDK